MSSAPTLHDIAAEWRKARRVYPVYAAVASRFGLPLGPCRHLESPIDRADVKVVEEFKDWLDEADRVVTAAQLRQVLQLDPVGTEDSLRTLVQRYLSLSTEANTHRDKIDFLLVQYLSHCAPAEVLTGTASFESVAAMLTPVIGDMLLDPPQWHDRLEQVIARLRQCSRLSELVESGVLSEGRELKQSVGDEFITPGALVAFTRYNFLVRRAFIQLLRSDLDAIRGIARQLEQYGIRELNLADAGLSANASLSDVRMTVKNWKSVFQADYAAGKFSFQPVIELRRLTETALNDAIAAELARAEEEAPVEAPEPEHEETKIEAPEGTLAAEIPVDVIVPEPTKPEPEAVAVRSVPAPQTARKEVPPPAVPQPEVQHARQQDPPMAEKAPSAPAASQPELTFTISTALETIAEQLFAAELQNVHLAVATVHLGKSKLILASWEVAAFLKGGDDVSDVLQEAVAARSVVLEFTERAKAGGPSSDKAAVLSVGHAEAARLQEKIAEARDARNIDAAVNLAATTKRLLQALDEAGKL